MNYNLLVMIILFSVKIIAQADTVKSYYTNGKLESIIVYEKNIRQGEAVYYFKNGNIKEKRNYVNDKVFGTVTSFYENGIMKEIYSIDEGRRDGPATLYDSTGNVTEDVIFENGVRNGQEFLLVGEYREQDYQKLLAQWKERQAKKNNSKEELNLPPEEDKNDLEDDPAYYMNVEVMPEPIGGMNTIYKKLTYPQEAKEKKIEGTVKILAFIEKNGEVSSAQVVEGIGYGCDENARISVYYTRFKPGLQKGKRIKIQMVIPIEFKLDETTK